MGKHYARLLNYPEAIALAIEEHYFPKGPGRPRCRRRSRARWSRSPIGSTRWSVASRRGLVPSGSADPFGLRRAAIGVLQILLDRGPGGAHYLANTGWPLRTDYLIDDACHAYGDTLPTDPARVPLRDFLRTRLRGLLIDEGLDTQDVDVILAVNPEDPCDCSRSRAGRRRGAEGDARGV